MVIFTVVFKKYDSESWGFLPVIRPEHMVRPVAHVSSVSSQLYPCSDRIRKVMLAPPAKRVISHPLPDESKVLESRFSSSYLVNAYGSVLSSSISFHSISTD